MPSNIITVQVGQCGNQLGMAFWERMCFEHGITPEGLIANEHRRGADCKEVFFNEANCGQKWVPRAVLVDLEPRVLNEICNYDFNQYSDLFDVDNIYQGPTGGGAGNNWARGYNQAYDIIEKIMSVIEIEAERADHLEAFAICHSILGGTGSGLGSRLLQELRDRFPKKVIQTYSTIQPMTCNVQVAPYNIMLSLDAITQHADMCLLFDNDAFEKQCKSVTPLQLQRNRRDGTNENLTNITGTEKNNYTQINSMMSQVMTSLTAPIRYYSPIYTRLMHISAMLNPFPPMIFSQPAFVPFVPIREDLPKQKLIKFPEPRNVLSYLLDPRQLITSSHLIAKKQESDARAKTAETKLAQNNNFILQSDDYRLLSGLIILQSTQMDLSTRIASSVDNTGMDIGNLYEHIKLRNQTQKNIYRSPPWMPSTMNLTSCCLSPYQNHEQHPITGLLLANHTSVSTCLKATHSDFEKMWKKRANVHGFENAFEQDGEKESGKKNLESKINESKDSLESLIELYRNACTERFVNSDFQCD